MELDRTEAGEEGPLLPQKYLNSMAAPNALQPAELRLAPSSQETFALTARGCSSRPIPDGSTHLSDDFVPLSDDSVPLLPSSIKPRRGLSLLVIKQKCLPCAFMNSRIFLYKVLPLAGSA